MSDKRHFEVSIDGKVVGDVSSTSRKGASLRATTKFGKMSKPTVFTLKETNAKGGKVYKGTAPAKYRGVLEPVSGDTVYRAGSKVVYTKKAKTKKIK